MKTILLFGGSGGLGKQIINELNNNYNCISINSSICDVTNSIEVANFLNNIDFDIIIYLSVKNIDGLIHKYNDDDINLQLNVNIKGFINVLKYSTELMRNKKYGRIIYISSILSKRPIKGAGIYSASKAFCDNLIKTYSLENSKYGITSNSIQLGYFEGGLTEKVPTKILNNAIEKISLKRLGTSNEISSLIDAIIKTEYINGTNIILDGGYQNE